MCVVQDAYALCRVFKKTACGPKIGEHYATTSTNNHMINTNHIASDHSSSIEIYSDGRCDPDFESSNYSMQPDSCSVPVLHRSSSHLDHVIAERFRDANRSCNPHFLSHHDDAFNSFISSPSFPNYGNMPYPPSKVLFFSFLFLICFSICIFIKLSKKKKKKKRKF